jgi:hypothetical protein
MLLGDMYRAGRVRGAPGIEPGGWPNPPTAWESRTEDRTLRRENFAVGQRLLALVRRARISNTGGLELLSLVL